MNATAFSKGDKIRSKYDLVFRGEIVMPAGTEGVFVRYITEKWANSLF